jgi:acyl-CoA thioesterase
MHPLDASLDLQPFGPATDGAQVFTGRTSSGYRNAIGPFGGWTAAALLEAVRRMPEVRGVPLALTTSFIAGIHEGEFEVRVALSRQNRSVGFWRSELWQAERMCAQALVTMAAVRETMVLRDARCPDVPPANAVAVYDNPRDPVPFLGQFVFKPVSGLLFTRADSMSSRIWIRDAEPRPVDALSLAVLCDTPFPPLWIRLDGQLPVSTVTYSVYFRGTAADLADAGSDFVLIDSTSAIAQGGYADQFSSVWSGSGRLLAQTQQLLWFSDAAPKPPRAKD